MGITISHSEIFDYAVPRVHCELWCKNSDLALKTGNSQSSTTSGWLGLLVSFSGKAIKFLFSEVSGLVIIIVAQLVELAVVIRFQNLGTY